MVDAKDIRHMTLAQLLTLTAELDEAWGTIPCPACGSTERNDWAPECAQHADGCLLVALLEGRG